MRMGARRPRGRARGGQAGKRVLITADGYQPLSSRPVEEGWFWKCQPRDRSRLTVSDSGSPLPFISRATRCPL